MNVFIFEGIATSGKSTIIQKLETVLSDRRLSISSEEDTHIPIMHNTADSHADFFINLIEKKLTDSPDIVIFDRLYLTQAFRSRNSLTVYWEVEELLLRNNAKTIFLKVSDEAIADRIHKASQHRDSDWQDYIKTKGKSIKQIAEYYSTQQANQLQSLQSSIIPYIIFDTTLHNYDEIAENLMSLAIKTK